MKAPICVARNSQKNLFVYGTLMAPEVIETLIDRVPRSQPALLLNEENRCFRRHPVQNFQFPGLISVELSKYDEARARLVQGILYSDLTCSEIKRLDWFEDEEYTKLDCTVQLLNGNFEEINQDAIVYLWTHPLHLLNLEDEWNYCEFRAKHLANYLETTVVPCRRELDKMAHDNDQ